MINDFYHENVVVNTNIGIRFWRSAVTTSGYVPFHWHSSIEIIYVLKGQLKFTINGQAFTVASDEFIVIPSGVVHDVSNQPNTAYQRAGYLIRQFSYLQGNHPTAYRFDSQICFISLLKVLFTELNNPDQQVPNDNNIKQLIIYINNHNTEQLSVAGLAHHFGYNSNYLSRLFHQQMGITLMNYIYVVKLNQLYDGLVNSNRDIKALFKQNGLTNPRTARKIFREMFGCLPSDIRRRHLRK